MQLIGRLMFMIMFTAMSIGVIKYFIDSSSRGNQLLIVMIIIAGVFTLIFGMAQLVENSGNQSRQPGIEAADLHKAYQSGFEQARELHQAHLAAAERRAMIEARRQRDQAASYERVHSQTIKGMIELSRQDKELVHAALETGLRLVQIQGQIFLQNSRGKIQEISQIDDMTPAKIKYMAQQQKLLGPGTGSRPGTVEAVYREI